MSLHIFPIHYIICCNSNLYIASVAPIFVDDGVCLCLDLRCPFNVVSRPKITQQVNKRKHTRPLTLGHLATGQNEKPTAQDKKKMFKGGKEKVKLRKGRGASEEAYNM